jgi:hypothetical protein
MNGIFYYEVTSKYKPGKGNESVVTSQNVTNLQLTEKQKNEKHYLFLCANVRNSKKAVKTTSKKLETAKKIVRMQTKILRGMSWRW